MEKIIQIFPSENEKWFIDGWKKWADKLILLDNIDQYKPDITLVTPMKFYNSFILKIMKNKNPYIGINRPYLGNHTVKHTDQWRVSVNSFANFNPKKTPYYRWPIAGLEYNEWKTKKVENILIAPPIKGVPIFYETTVNLWAESIANSFPGANIKIRYKKDQSKGKNKYATLWTDFDWADLVISFMSASTVEAFWYGKKVISLGGCPTQMCQSPSLKNWQDPKEPVNRKEFHNHIAWLQFKKEEWESGEAQEMTVFYQGWPPETEHYWPLTSLKI